MLCPVKIAEKELKILALLVNYIEEKIRRVHYALGLVP